MHEPDAPRSASAEEEARIGEMPAVFANKVYVTRMPGGGAKITFAEARQSQGEERASLRVGGIPAARRSRRPAPPAGLDRKPR